MLYASVFTNGGSQAVRIPAAFRLATDRVSVEAVDGGILLCPVVPKKKSFFEFLRSARLEEGELDLTRDCRRGWHDAGHAQCFGYAAHGR